jgi:hypothetical protein
MISPLLQSLIDAPLANATKINLPGGKSPAPRPKKSDATDDIGGPKLTMKQVRERKDRAAAERLSKLFDYYATTDLTAEKIAEHLGLYRNTQTGTDKDGKPIISRVLDVERAEQQIAWRRKSA